MSNSENFNLETFKLKVPVGWQTRRSESGNSKFYVVTLYGRSTDDTPSYSLGVTVQHTQSENTVSLYVEYSATSLGRNITITQHYVPCDPDTIHKMISDLAAQLVPHSQKMAMWIVP